MEEKDDVTYPIKMGRARWDMWVMTIPRGKTINDALVELVLKDLVASGEREKKGMR